MSSPTTTSEILRMAADNPIERGGLPDVLNSIYSAHGRGLGNTHDRVTRHLANFLGLPFIVHALDAIHRWNYTPGRTAEEILDALRGAACEALADELIQMIGKLSANPKLIQRIRAYLDSLGGES